MQELLAADSFRVRANPGTGAAEVRGLARHLDRFRQSAREAWCGPHRQSEEERAQHAAARREALDAHPDVAPSALLVFIPPIWTSEEQRAIAEIERFLHEALARIAEFGEGFPRLELLREQPGAEPRPALRLRPLPELLDTIELRTAGPLDVGFPARKGPNIERYAQLNHELRAEALLLDERGRVLEGATTSLVWWPRSPDGPDPHGSVVESERRVASVTESLLVEAGGRRLVGVKPDRRRIGQPQPRSIAPRRLAAHEVWAVNALHGIRVVTGIDGAPLPAPDERRLKWFREALDRSWEPVLA